MNTLVRFLCAFLVAGAVVAPASAQSVFYFPHLIQGDGLPSSLTMTNPGPVAADVEFELTGLDGQPAPSAVSPVRYRVQPESVLSLDADVIFASGQSEGWMRISTSESGVRPRVLAGDVENQLEEVPPAVAAPDQIVAIPAGENAVGRLRVVNPSGRAATVSITYFDSEGRIAGSVPTILEAGAGSDLDLAAVSVGSRSAFGVRISASEPVLAQAELGGGGARVFANGQAVAGSAAALRFAPHAVVGNGFSSTLVLSNPAAQSVTVFATLFNHAGGPVHASQATPRRYTLTIPANGTVSLGVGQLSGLLLVPAVNGWVRIESPNVPLAGYIVVSRNGHRTAFPLETSPRTQTFFAQAERLNAGLSGLVVTNPGEAAADVDLAVVDRDGFTLTRSSLRIEPRTKVTALVGDLLPGVDLGPARTVAVESSAPLYSALIAGGPSGSIAAIGGDAISPWPERAVVSQPAILTLDPSGVRPGDILRIWGEGLDISGTLLFGETPVPIRTLAPGIAAFRAEVPGLSPGFVDVRYRATDGRESESRSVLVVPPGPAPIREIRGRAFYEKIDVGPNGLNLSRPVMIPIRDGRVEVFNRGTGEVFSAVTTDGLGAFRAVAPLGPGFDVRVLSQSFSTGFLVANNTGNGGVYVVGADLDVGSSPVLLASDLNRVSGAFNILEVIRKGNSVLRQIDPSLQVPVLQIFWSPANSRAVGDPAVGRIGGTFFDAQSGIAFVLGDRNTDSDEFDDAVILHEYAHLLAARFSRDDSRGGAHEMGDVLDPRVAWSEGWANFFSGLIRDDRIYRDSLGPAGTSVLEYDLEVNVPPGDEPGIWSEFSVHSILWDLVDEVQDEGDTTRIDVGAIWEAFTGLKDDRYVYLPLFLDRLVERVPEDAIGIEQIVRQRSIDYFASGSPTVPDPFPRLVSGQSVVTGDVDSLSRQRPNLAQSAHQYAFDVAGGPMSLRLDITGLGTGGNPRANDLDLFLMDSEGRVLAQSDRGLNGQSELISTFLSPGRYVVEIRSFYTQGETGMFVFNSGSYRLQFNLP